MTTGALTLTAKTKTGAGTAGARAKRAKKEAPTTGISGGPPMVQQLVWQQFDDAEKLEELRLYRPAAFQALPEAP